MRFQHTAPALALALAATLGGGCRNDDRDVTRARTPNANQLAREGELLLSDSQVVQALRTPNVVGRIIYEPPVDLSLANAMRTRPDLFADDTTRRATSSAATRHDTTGGDATADTSGGAARRKRP